MNITEIHSLLTEEFGAEVIVGLEEDAIDPWIEVAPKAIADVGAFLKHDERLGFDHLNNLCGVDYLEPDPKKQKKFEHEPHIEVVYHLTNVAARERTVIKVKLPRWKGDEPGQLPEVPSVAGVWAIADWHERETYDLVGIRFLDHPNHRRILCPEDWVGHPLRKDYEFPVEYHGIRGK